MAFIYRAITANCGNDSIGNVASEKIAELLDEKADFFVINCQEVDVNKTKDQLERLAQEKGHEVKCLAKMATHTKLSTQFHFDTGIASYIIHKKGFTVEVDSCVEARRDYKRFGGSAYNKGGLVTDFTVTKMHNGQPESLTVQTISGHLDSNDTKKRIIDWSNLHKASSQQKVDTWDDLVKACPHLRLSGYDANTRDKLEGALLVNLLTEKPDDPEVQALYRAPITDNNFSVPTTYSKSFDKSPEDKKRPGYAARGMLDYVGISDGRMPVEHISTKSVITVEAEDSTKRDHCVVISPVQEYVRPSSEFAVVQDQMASRLHHAAPELAQEIRCFSESDEAKAKLRGIYNTYLSTPGLLNNAIVLHTTKLEHFNRLIAEDSFLKSDELKKQLADTLFQNTKWCEGSPKILAAKQNLMSVFLESLVKCHYESALTARLSWYTQLEARIEQNPDIDVVDEFKELTMDEYIRARNKFKEALNGKGEEKLQEAGLNILAQLDLIVNPDRLFLRQQHLDIKSLDRLTLIAGQCQKAYEEIDAKKDNIPGIFKELEGLFDDSGRNSSPIWKVLVDLLKAFVYIVSKIFGLDVTESNTNNKDKAEEKLIDYVLKYKSVIHGIAQQDRSVEVGGQDSSSEERHNIKIV
jgi:hypothetical protein